MREFNFTYQHPEMCDGLFVMISAEERDKDRLQPSLAAIWYWLIIKICLCLPNQYPCFSLFCFLASIDTKPSFFSPDKIQLVFSKVIYASVSYYIFHIPLLFSSLLGLRVYSVFLCMYLGYFIPLLKWKVERWQEIRGEIKNEPHYLLAVPVALLSVVL